jgi:hypothetical protein
MGILLAFSMGQVYCRTRDPGKTAAGGGGVNQNEALDFKGGGDGGGGGLCMGLSGLESAILK